MITKREVRKYAYDLASSGKVEYCLLSELEKEKITSLIIQGCSLVNIWEYITEADFKNELPFMLSAYLNNKDRDLGSDILEKLVTNAVNYAAKEAIGILEEQSSEYNFNKQFDFEED